MASESRTAIESAIPHRAPFLFVDRVVERGTSGDGLPRIVTEWDVPPDGDWFRGHYPGHPVLPGVLISEFTFQSAAILLSARSAGQVDAVPMLIGIENARFRRVVQPGETLRAEVSLVEELSAKHYLRALVTTGGKTVLRLRFAIALASISEHPEPAPVAVQES